MKHVDRRATQPLLSSFSFFVCSQRRPIFAHLHLRELNLVSFLILWSSGMVWAAAAAKRFLVRSLVLVARPQFPLSLCYLLKWRMQKCVATGHNHCLEQHDPGEQQQQTDRQRKDLSSCVALLAFLADMFVCHKQQSFLKAAPNGSGKRDLDWDWECVWGREGEGERESDSGSGSKSETGTPLLLRLLPLTRVLLVTPIMSRGCIICCCCSNAKDHENDHDEEDDNSSII